MSGVTVEAKGLKEIDKMFRELPKDVNSALIWGRFWKKVSKPLKQAAEKNAPLLDTGETGRIGVAYPADPKLTIGRGTLKRSVKFYRTSASRKKDVHGAYIGPRVKGKFKKNKGGYFGAWVEYGHKNRDGSMSKPNPWMAKAFTEKSGTVLTNGFKEATDIFVKAVKSYEKKMAKI
tara:strand:- start:56 stop:583 length:528 start_codon:yes stop_codon:yes gene_type:complete